MKANLTDVVNSTGSVLVDIHHFPLIFNTKFILKFTKHVCYMKTFSRLTKDPTCGLKLPRDRDLKNTSPSYTQ